MKMAEENPCCYWLCQIQNYCPHKDPAYLARWARADEEDKNYFAEHPRPDPSLYVDASSDDEDAMDVEESGLPSPPVSPRDTNHNITTIVNGNAAQAHHSPSYPPPTALSHSIPVQNSRVYKSRRRPVASTHERFILLLSLFMLVTNKLL